MSEVLVIGHKNPDTDAICSAIGYAEFKRLTGMPEAVAACCGDINDRAAFVLKTFGVQPPMYVSDVSPTVKDVMQTNVISIEPDTTIAQALAIMDEGHVRVLPVLNADRSCRGLVSMLKISRLIFPAANRVTDSRLLRTSLGGLVQTLGGSLEYGTRPVEEEELTMVIGAMSVESFGSRMVKYDRDKLVVLVGNRWDVQNMAIREKVRCLVVTGGLKLEPKTLESARENKVSVILSPHDTATTANLCRAAMAVRHVLHEDFDSFEPDEKLSNAQRAASDSKFQAFPVVTKKGTTVGILSKSDFLQTIDRKLILVDHNELSQAVRGADKVEILEIIDHHRIGSLTTSQPILFRNEPVGSTSTIVADCFFRYGVELKPSIAGLLLAGLVSDTLNLSSPTATTRDAEILKELERISGVDAAEFTEKLFASGSVLKSKTTDEAIVADCKEYAEDGATFSVAQIEEIGFDHFWERSGDVKDSLERYRKENGYLFSALLVTDVVRRVSLLLVVSDESFTPTISYPEIEPGIYDCGDVVSRKKQLMPFLTKCLAEAID
jgi:manganese-dependent inorganic pyrophosphatase